MSARARPKRQPLSQPPIHRPRVFDAVVVMHEGREIKPPRAPRGDNDTFGDDLTLWMGAAHQTFPLPLPLLGVLGVLAVERYGWPRVRL